MSVLPQGQPRNRYRICGDKVQMGSGAPLQHTADKVERPSQTGDRGVWLERQLKDKLIEHKQYPDRRGQAPPDVRGYPKEHKALEHPRHRSPGGEVPVRSF